MANWNEAVDTIVTSQKDAKKSTDGKIKKTKKTSQLNVEIDAEVHTKAAVKALLEKVYIKDIVNDFLFNWVLDDHASVLTHLDAIQHSLERVDAAMTRRKFESNGTVANRLQSLQTTLENIMLERIMPAENENQ